MFMLGLAPLPEDWHLKRVFTRTGKNFYLGEQENLLG